jgi:hypothetical protein
MRALVDVQHDLYKLWHQPTEVARLTRELVLASGAATGGPASPGPLHATRAAQLAFARAAQHAGAGVEARRHAHFSAAAAAGVLADAASATVLSGALPPRIRAAALCAAAGLLLAFDADVGPGHSLDAVLGELAERAAYAARALQDDCCAERATPGTAAWLLVACCGAAAALVASTSIARRAGVAAGGAGISIAVCTSQHVVQLAQLPPGELPIQPHIGAVLLSFAACVSAATSVHEVMALLQPLALACRALVEPATTACAGAADFIAARGDAQAAVVPLLWLLLCRAEQLTKEGSDQRASDRPLAPGAAARRLLEWIPGGAARRGAATEPPAELAHISAVVAHAASYAYDEGSRPQVPQLAPLLGALLATMRCRADGVRLLVSAPTLRSGATAAGPAAALPPWHAPSAAFLLILAVPCLPAIEAAPEPAQRAAEWDHLSHTAAPAALAMVSSEVDVGARGAATDFLLALLRHAPQHMTWVQGTSVAFTAALVRLHPSHLRGAELRALLAALAAACGRAATLLACCGEVLDVAELWLATAGNVTESTSSSDIPVTVAVEFGASMFAMILHGPVSALDEALCLLSGLWRRVPSAGRAAMATDMRGQLAACHHAAKKPKCARWFHAELHRAVLSAL